jgi:ABC-type transport system involved in multi-copper enzyme maturation, permease component
MNLARYEGRKRLRGSVYLSVAVSALAALDIWVYPSFRDAFEGEEFLDAYPDQLLQLFDIRTMTTIEGFLATELYVFGWILLLGLYLAYLAAGRVAGDIEHERMDILLSLPISRARTVTEVFAALAVPIVVVNLLPPVVVVVGGELIGESVAVADLLAVHVLSIPYLFACASIGLVASVVADRADIARRVALGVVFGLYLVESLVVGTDYEAAGVVAPSRHYDPAAILIDSNYDPRRGGSPRRNDRPAARCECRLVPPA